MKKISIGLVLLLSFLVRIWDITSLPPSPYWDEMDAGYQAYSLLKTGKDYFGNWPGFAIHSFADYRAPLMIYTTVPFVEILGLNIFSIRFPSVLFGTISVFLIYILSKLLFKSEKISLTAALLTGLAPWSIHYSRIAFESSLLLSLFLAGIICFLKGLKNSKWWIPSGTFLGLSLFAYNTAKLFIPLILISLIFCYIRKKGLNKNFWISSVLFLTFLFAAFYTNISQGGGMRFAEIAIWTDPQLESSIDQFRQESALTYTKSKEAGMSARIIDKLIYNKITYILDKITQNYLKALSVDFLFITGDPNLRHSSNKTGEFYRIELITIIFGLLLLAKIHSGDKNAKFLLFWAILSAVPASLTRDGGTHASRLFLMFPALTLISAAGFFYIRDIIPKRVGRFTSLGLILMWIFGVVFYLNYYFGAYKFESAKHFQYGFREAVNEAINRNTSFKYVIIDDRNDSALMSYLFESKYNPVDFQAQSMKLQVDLGGFKADRLGNFYFMKPGRRDWYQIFKKNSIDDEYLLIASAQQLEEQTVEKMPARLTENQKLLNVIYYQNGDVAFYIIQSKKPGGTI